MYLRLGDSQQEADNFTEAIDGINECVITCFVYFHRLAEYRKSLALRGKHLERSDRCMQTSSMVANI